MEIKIQRYSFSENDTLGLLFIDGIFQCFTLEDQVREGEKVMHETAIPYGEYDVKFREVGGFHNRYENRYGKEFHKGMLELQDVPNFKYILIHCGNEHRHSSGCLLVGDSATQNITKDGLIGRSRDAYQRVYPIIRDALLKGENVKLKIIKEDEEAEKKI